MAYAFPGAQSSDLREGWVSWKNLVGFGLRVVELQFPDQRAATPSSCDFLKTGHSEKLVLTSVFERFVSRNEFAVFVPLGKVLRFV